MTAEREEKPSGSVAPSWRWQPILGRRPATLESPRSSRRDFGVSFQKIPTRRQSAAPCFSEVLVLIENDAVGKRPEPVPAIRQIDVAMAGPHVPSSGCACGAKRFGFGEQADGLR